MKRIVTATLTALSLFGAAQAFADDTVIDRNPSDYEGPDSVTIRGLSYAGTGCPAGSVDADIPTSADSFNLMWDQMTAEVGPGVAFTERRKNCAMSINLDYPQGWTFGVERLSAFGTLDLGYNVGATVTAKAYIQGSSQTATATKSFSGPSYRSFYVSQPFSDASTVWAPCNARRALNLNFSVALASASSWAQGQITLGEDASGASVALKWKRCN